MTRPKCLSQAILPVIIPKALLLAIHVHCRPTKIKTKKKNLKSLCFHSEIDRNFWVERYTSTVCMVHRRRKLLNIRGEGENPARPTSILELRVLQCVHTRGRSERGNFKFLVILLLGSIIKIKARASIYKKPNVKFEYEQARNISE